MLPCLSWPRRLSTPMLVGVSLLALALMTRAAEPAPAVPPAEIAPVVAIPLSVQVPAAGQVSVGIYDAQGQLWRSVAFGQAVAGAGPQRWVWDGTDDLGRPMAAGTYSVRGVAFAQGPQVSLRGVVGVSGTPPYPTPDGMGGWGGNLGPPMAVCGNSKAVAAVFTCVESPYNTGVQLMDGDGKLLRRYHTFFPWDVRFAGAMDEGHLYVALANLGAKRLVVARYALNDPKGAVLADLPVHGVTTPDGRWKGRWTTDVQGLAVGGGRVYATVIAEDQLFVLDAGTGALLHTVSVLSPRGVAVRAGQVYVLSGTHLLVLDADGKTSGTVPVAGLEDPSGLALDAAGNFYVADGGAAQQVKVFAPDGRALPAIGKAGGRPADGVYDPAGMRTPRGVAIGPDGNLWVAEAEERFQRISVWQPATDKLAHEFFNTRISSGQGQLTADHRTMLFTSGVYADAPGISAYTIDLASGRWSPAWSLNQPQATMQQESTMLGNPHPNPLGARQPYLSFAGDCITARGHRYLVGADCSLWLYDDPNKPPRLAALVYTHRVKGVPKDDAAPYEGDYDQGPNLWLTWSDRVGDGQMRRAGCTLTKDPPLLAQTTRLFGWEVQPDLSIAMMCPVGARGKPLQWAVRVLPVHELLADGTPVYDWADLTELVRLQVPSFTGGDGWKGGEGAYLMDLHLHDGVVDTYAEPITQAKLRLPGIDGDGWWASRHWRQTPLRFDVATGAPAWLRLGRRAAGRAQPGEMYHPVAQPCSAGGCLFVADTMGQVWAWTAGGLYLGPLYHDPPALDADSIQVELVGSFVYEHEGKIYACTGDHGVRVHEVTLPALTTLDGGKVTLTPAQAAAARPWDPDGPTPGVRPVYTAFSLYDYAAKQAVRAITVDGKLDPAEWGGVPAMPLSDAGQVVGEVRALWEPHTLYLAYTIHAPGGLRNAGTELPFSPFTSGAYVDFCLGPQWSTPQRETGAAGDVRVVLARIAGVPPTDYQMAFWPQRTGGQHPQTIASPAAQRHFDDIAPLPGVTCAYTEDATGYCVEVAVPLAAVGLDQKKPVTTIGFDASVGLADASGTLRQRALHWGGESEGAVVDRPGAAALKPWTWGTLFFDRTPLPAAKAP